MKTKPDFIDQRGLARELGVTDRRIRQMVKEYLLPEPRKGRYRLAQCRQWTDLQRRGSAREWLDFYDTVSELGRVAEEKFDVAMAEGSTKDDLGAAGLAVQDLFAALRFVTAAKSDSDAERDFHMLFWKHLEDEALRRLLGRAMVMIAAERGIPVEQLKIVDEAA